MKEPRQFIQVVMGPRQIGKTTLIRQVLNDIDLPFTFFTADNIPATQSDWIADCWESVRAKIHLESLQECVLVIDEIQKIENWSEAVKREWDADTFNGVNIKVILLGSSRIMLLHGLSESLMGRFEEIRMAHWSYPEMRDAFGYSLEQYIFFGGYPGSASLIKNEERWRAYVHSTIVDATINKDILYNSVVSKPALLRQTFELGASYSGEIVSLTKMVGALQDAGNTTTLAGYLNLLDNSGLLAGLQKHSIDNARKRASIPKFQVYNNALKVIFSNYRFKEAQLDRKQYGRLFESAVGCHLINHAFTHHYTLNYWRDGNDEVDFIISKNGRSAAIEVKSNTVGYNTGLSVFRDKFHPVHSLIVGDGGMRAEDFFCSNPADLLR
uniref:ATP-binding protein n=2 Tax=unclassified Prevotella TaxID=2638335 RepID=A0AB33J4Z7_9BACT